MTDLRVPAALPGIAGRPPIHVPFVDLRAQYAAIREAVLPALAGICENATFILGPAVEEFEAAFARYCGARHAVGVANGTDALELALRAVGVGPGDEVIVPALTYFATGVAVSHAGATPVFVDIGPDYLIDPGLLEAAITPRTRAVMPVHLYGQPADLDAVVAVAYRHGLTVIEDCAQSHGAQYRERPAGTFGRVACFSFYPGKNLGAYGDGGALITSDDSLAEKLRALRNVGAFPHDKYRHLYLGRNSRLDSLRAAVLSVKLPYLPQWNAARQAHARSYVDLLSRTAGVDLPMARPDRSHVYHLFVVRVPDRDRVAQALRGAGVQPGVHYPVPMHLHPAFAPLGGRAGQQPVAERACEGILSLPMFPEFTPEQVAHVAECLSRAVAQA